MRTNKVLAEVVILEEDSSKDEVNPHRRHPPMHPRHPAT